MAVLPIVLYPDPRLKERSVEIDLEALGGVPDEELNRLIDDLIETMNDSKGCVGVAAPQTGFGRRVVVIDASRNSRVESSLGFRVIINPVLTASSGSEIAREGCLSLPHLTANVARSTSISMNYLDRNLNPAELTATGFEARLLLHEIDHLDGILFLDRVACLKTDVFRRKRYK